MLLVGGIVLLVDDEEADIAERCEEGRAWPDDDVGASLVDRFPACGALGLTQSAVQEDGATGEPGRDSLDDLCR